MSSGVGGENGFEGFDVVEEIADANGGVGLGGNDFDQAGLVGLEIGIGVGVEIGVVNFGKNFVAFILEM